MSFASDLSPLTAEAVFGFAPLCASFETGAPRLEGDPRVWVTGGGLRALEREEAVGLLKRSAAELLSVTLRIGVGASAEALRAFANDAAVGANKLDEGVFALAGIAWEAGVLEGVGVFEREAESGVFSLRVLLGVPELVFGLEGVLGAFGGTDLRVEDVDAADCPVCCGRKVGGLEVLLTLLGLVFACDLEGVRKDDGGGDFVSLAG